MICGGPVHTHNPITRRYSVAEKQPNYYLLALHFTPTQKIDVDNQAR